MLCNVMCRSLSVQAESYDDKSCTHQRFTKCGARPEGDVNPLGGGGSESFVRKTNLF
jgi:hypothetical protein